VQEPGLQWTAPRLRIPIVVEVECRGVLALGIPIVKESGDESQ
jgi:hypothetical protein